MEILWSALGISAIVILAFYVLAQHWQRVLRQQAWTIQRLAARIRDVEEMADPAFRRRLSESTPVPLTQVFTLSFRLGDSFWRDALRIGEEDLKFVREFGSLVGSVKLEQWRSHTVATIMEILPDRKTTGWQTRSLDFYPDPAKNHDALSLWELALSRPGLSAERPPSLELLLRGNSLELCGHLTHLRQGSSSNGHQTAPRQDDMVFFCVPLDTVQLSRFRSHDPLASGNNGSTNFEAVTVARECSWQEFYSDRNEELDIEWELRLRDLDKKAEWERWKVLET
jgi:hypothetical protein